MGVRTWIANGLMGFGRRLGRKAGAELAVDVDEHSIDIGMEYPNKTDRAWDPEMFAYGNLFVSDKANPIKPVVNRNDDLEEPDTVDTEQSDVTDDDETEVRLISSGRYQEYMRQKLVEELLNPKEQWRLIMYAVIGLGVLQFLAIAVTLFATGSF